MPSTVYSLPASACCLVRRWATNNCCASAFASVVRQNSTPWTRPIDYPYQKVVHQVAKLHTRYALPSGGTLEWQAAYQHDDRREFNQRRNFRSHVPTLDLQLESFQTDGRWQQSYADHWTTEAGLFYANVKNTNTPGTGVVPIIPNYVQQNAGVFAIQKYSGHEWGAEAGARLDHQRLNARGIDLYGRPYGKLDHYNNVTYTLGAHAHVLPGLDVLTNVGSAWRAPHVTSCTATAWSIRADSSHAAMPACVPK